MEAALGTPASEAESPSAEPDVPAYKGLGYECSQQLFAGLQPVGREGPPYCSTIYYLDGATGVLGGFWTISTRYATSHGTRVGTSTQVAAEREHHPAIIGCLAGIDETNRTAFLFISIRGGRIKPSTQPNQPSHLSGGRVSSIAIESHHDPVGILFC